MFLGRVVEQGNIWKDQDKVKAIQEQQPPQSVSELRSFLGSVNYYYWFVVGYSRIVNPLTELLKKSKGWAWTNKCQKAFDDLKRAMLADPSLIIPNVYKPFDMQTDDLDFAFREVLLQDEHPIAQESRKPSEAEQRCTTHEKELLALVHCVHVLRQCFGANGSW